MQWQIDVNGPNTHPVYKFLKECFPGDITWNFASKVPNLARLLVAAVSLTPRCSYKFIVDREGVPVARFEKESWEEITKYIEGLLEVKKEAK